MQIAARPTAWPRRLIYWLPSAAAADDLPGHRHVTTVVGPASLHSARAGGPCEVRRWVLRQRGGAGRQQGSIRSEESLPGCVGWPVEWPVVWPGIGRWEKSRRRSFQSWCGDNARFKTSDDDTLAPVNAFPAW